MLKELLVSIRRIARISAGVTLLIAAMVVWSDYGSAAVILLAAGLHILVSQPSSTSGMQQPGARAGRTSAGARRAHGKRQPLRSGTDGLDDDMFEDSPGSEINPATGLPMAGGRASGVDVGGNVYGTTSALHEAYEPTYENYEPDYGIDSFDSYSSDY